MYSRNLKNEIHSIINFFRTIFSDDRDITNEIDETYEEVILGEIDLVPQQFDEDILKYFKIFKIVIFNINYGCILKELNTFDIPRLNIDSFNMVSEGLNSIVIDRKNKLRVINILTKFKPIFKCIDKVISMPINILKKINNMMSDKYNDIL